MDDIKKNDHVDQKGWQLVPGEIAKTEFSIFDILYIYILLDIFLIQIVKFDSSDPKKGFFN